jgi:hypothetical protein
VAVFWCASDAVHVTVVVPSANALPDAGEHAVATAPSTRSVAEAAYVTTVVDPVAVTAVVAGTVITGAVVSTTVTVKLALPVL